MIRELIEKDKTLVIDESYLAAVKGRAPLHEEFYLVLEKDISRLGEDAIVAFQSPSNGVLAPLYADVLAYVCYKATQQNLTLKPSNAYDAGKIRAILGNKVAGDLEHGYQFRRVA